MDVLASTRLYISEMVKIAGPQMKVMLLDKETTSIVSCAYAQSDMMQKEVYLFERLDSPHQRETIKHLKCIVFIRPTPENIQLLASELRNPKYAQYYIYFSNVVSKTDVKTLAEADEHESVREVHEFFSDSVPLCSHLCSMNLSFPYENSMGLLAASAFLRIKQSIVGLLLQLKKKPTIRFVIQSSIRFNVKRACKKTTATAVQCGCGGNSQKKLQVIRREESLFESASSESLLIILDRSDDPVTPLLNQWTYEAMVHELIGFSGTQRVQLDGQSIILSEQYDEFFRKNVNSNFGEIGQNIKSLMNEFQQKSQIHKNLESISDMKNFVEEYPQFKKISGTVTKHVGLVSELSKIVSAQNLLEISEVEQTIVSGGDHSKCLERIKSLLNNPKTTQLNALRLLLLYSLRFETYPNNEITALSRTVDSKAGSREFRATELVRTILRFGGASRRKSDLFGDGSTIEMTKRFIKGIKGVENIYTQHEPHIKQIVELLTKAKLPEQNYGYISADGLMANTRYENVIIYMIGGLTFEESAVARAANERRATGQGGPAILLASNQMHNAHSFMSMLSHMGVHK
ncbi:hypothetical protein WR25_09429 [Diploscapter pachys]|uniref:Vacuolar protein sorting-associated protein 45 n=1 Tax=Diploscapter pachys TaxID=2018661 RepID=A0A2A2LM87_9BILA|nr:hypothetical protein WR25_09429 [Diploscapter pachys]